MQSEDQQPERSPVSESKRATSKPRTLQRRLLRAVLLYVVVPYVAVTVIFVALQRRLMYKPTAAHNLTMEAVGYAADFGKDVELTTSDGSVIRGWLINGRDISTADSDNTPLVLYFPGNSLNRSERISDLREVAARGFDVLIFDYRGFGDSEGSPSETALSQDARQVWAFATEELGYQENHIVVFGESLGGAVALSVWDPSHPKSPQPAAVILNSTFASMPQTVAWHYPMFPFQFFLFDTWPSIDRIANVRSPVIVFHGTEDQMVPVSHGEQLANAAADSRFVEITGGTHNEIPTWQLRKELDALANRIGRPME